VNLEGQTFAAIYQMIVTILQKECAESKAKKNFSKQMHFSTKLCNNFKGTYNFGCHMKSERKVSKKTKFDKSYSCKNDKYFPKKKNYFPSKRSFKERRVVFRKRSKPSKKVVCFICGKEGRYANTCRERKDRKQMKVITTTK